MILSHAEYHKQFKNLDGMFEYTKPHTSDNVVLSGFMKWDDDDACGWGGPYIGNFVCFKITDNRKNRLQKIEEVNKQQRDFYIYGTWSWPHGILKKYFDAELLTDCGNYFKCYVDDQLCSRSKLSEEELTHLLDESLLHEYYHYKAAVANIETTLEKDPWYKEQPTKEYPFKIYMFGTDDCSFTRCCRDKHEARDIIDRLEKNPNFGFLKELDFVFTN